MAKKIQVSTVKQMADVQVINMSTRFVGLAIKAQVSLKTLIDAATEPVTVWNEEKRIWEEQLDENGNKITRVAPIDGETVSKTVMPFLNELVEALEGGE